MSVNLKTYQSQLAQLVALPSVSCAVPSWDMPNISVIECLANWLNDLGFNTRIQHLKQSGKANLIATIGSGAGGLVLAGHSDTVPYDENAWQGDPFKLELRDEKFFGLGATDMKGFFPVILQAVEPFLKNELGKKDFKSPLIIIATADEESSMNGARELAQMGLNPLKPRAAIIGEPTALKPIRMHKGILMEAVRVQGQSGHSSNPNLGKSALEAMHHVITEIMQLRGEMQNKYRNPGFAIQYPTLNMGCIHGGDGANRICGKCEMHFDVRFLPGMDSDDIRSQISARLKPIAEKTGTDIVLSHLFEGVNAFEEPQDSELVKICEELTQQSSEAVAFATEAPFMKEMGLQTVILGPGSIDQAHQPNEFISVDQIEPAVKMVRQLIQKYCL